MSRIMKHYAFAFLLASMMLFAGGCGSGEGESVEGASGSAGAQESVTSAGQASETASLESQLPGTWFSEADTELVGIEFIDGGKVMLMYGRRGQDVVTMDYSLLEGERMSFVGPGGMTLLFNVKVEADRLHMAKTDEKEMQQFRRLAEGETVASALEAKAERLRREAEELAQRNRDQAQALAERVASLLTSANATIKPVNPEMASTPHMALEVEKVENNRFNGFAYFENPGRKHELTGTITPQVNTGKAIVQLRFGNQVDPPYQPIARTAARGAQNPNYATATGPPDVARQTIGLTLNLQTTGDADEPALTGPMTFGGSRPVEMTIAVDDTLHPRLVEALAAELRLREKKRAPIADMLKARAYLTGSISIRNEPADISIILNRNADDQDYTALVRQMSANSTLRAFPLARATIDVTGVMPSIAITGSGVNVQLNQFDPNQQTITGTWGNMPITMQVVQAWSDDQLENELQAPQKLATSTPLRGMIGCYFAQYYAHTPVEMTLQEATDGSITGKATFPSAQAEAQIVGKTVDTPVGPIIMLQFADGKGTPDMGIPILKSLQAGHMELSIIGTSPLQLTGMFRPANAREQALNIALSAHDAQHAATLQQRIEGKLAAREPKDALTLRLLSSGFPKVAFKRLDNGAIVGQFDENGHMIRAGQPAVFITELAQDNGWPVLTLRESVPEGARKYDTQFRLYAIEHGKQLRMLGTLSNKPNPWNKLSTWNAEFIAEAP